MAGQGKLSPDKITKLLAEYAPYLESPRHAGEIYRVGGQYSLISFLGKGGMACTFLAINEGTSQRVAVKIPLPEYLRDGPSSDLLRRFETEQIAAAALGRHPHVVMFDNAGGGSGSAGFAYAFLCMEYVPGRTLREKLTAWHGRLPQIEVVRIGIEVTDGLSFIHGGGYTHRDLKPDNLILDALEGERVRIADFGVACCLEHMKRDISQGFPVGTLEYIAPERLEDAAGHAMSERADLYSLGCILFQAVCGRSAFPAAGSYQKQLERIRSSPLNFPLRVHKRLASLISDLLAITPEKRPGSALEVRDVLSAIPLGELYAVDRPKRTWPRLAADKRHFVSALAAASYGVPPLWCEGRLGMILGLGRRKRLSQELYEATFQAANALLRFLPDLRSQDPVEMCAAVTSILSVLKDRRKLLVRRGGDATGLPQFGSCVQNAIDQLGNVIRTLESSLAASGDVVNLEELEGAVLDSFRRVRKCEDSFIEDHAFVNDRLLSALITLESRPGRRRLHELNG